MNCIKKAVSADEASLFLTSVANTAYDSQKIESNYCFIRLKLLQDTNEKFRVSKAERNWWTQAEELLEGFEEVFEGIRLGCRETLDDAPGKISI